MKRKFIGNFPERDTMTYLERLRKQYKEKKIDRHTYSEGIRAFKNNFYLSFPSTKLPSQVDIKRIKGKGKDYYRRSTAALFVKRAS